MSQHASGNRPIGLQAAIAYAKGFGVTLAEISPRLALEVAEGSRHMSVEESFAPFRGADASQAHLSSYWNSRMAPKDDSPWVEWGAMKADELPEVFLVTVPDNAMADRVPKGHSARFDRTLKAKAEDGVLVVDAQGNWFFRIYMPGAGDRFVARAQNKDFPPLESDRDGLTVVGVCTWYGQEGRWG